MSEGPWEPSAATLDALLARQRALDDALLREQPAGPQPFATIHEAGALSLAFLEEEFKQNRTAVESLRHFVTHSAPGLVNKLSLQVRLREVGAAEFDRLCQKKNQGTCLREALRKWLRSEQLVDAPGLCVPRMVAPLTRARQAEAGAPAPAYLLKMAVEFRGFEDPTGHFEVLCETGGSWCAQLLAEVRWQLFARDRPEEAYTDVTARARLPPPRVITLLSLPWPVNLPPPSVLAAGWPRIRRWFGERGGRHAWRAEQGLEPGCWVPFVLLNGVAWALEGREVPPLDHALLRQWDKRNNSLAGRAPDTTFSRSLQTGPGSLVREVYKISATASTPGGTRRRAVAWRTGRADKTEKAQAADDAGETDVPLAPARAEADEAADGPCAQYHLDNMHNQETLVVGAKRQRRLHLYPGPPPAPGAPARDPTLRRSYGNKQNPPPHEFAQRWAARAAEQRGPGVTGACLPPARLQHLVRAQARADSAQPVLTARVFVGQPCDLPFVLLWRALGVRRWGRVRALVARGDDAGTQALYLDLVQRSWALNEGVVRRKQALFRLGQLWCLRGKHLSQPEMEAQGLWWLRHRFLLHIFPGPAPWLAQHLRRAAGLPPAAADVAALAADYALDEEREAELQAFGDARKAEHLADSARALVRAEAGLPSLLAVSRGQPAAGLSDPLAMQNRAVLTLAQLYAHNLQRAIQRVRVFTQSRLASWGGLAVCVEPSVLLDSAQLSRVFQEFASPRDKAASASDAQPLQRVLQNHRGNLAKKYSLARRVCQMVPNGQGMTSDQRFDVSQMGYLDPNETSKSAKSGYDKRLALFSAVTPELERGWALALEDWLAGRLADDPGPAGYVVECHGRVVGALGAPAAERLADDLRALKRAAQHDSVADAGGLGLRHLGVLLDPDERRVLVHTYPGRLSAPVLHVQGGAGVPLPAPVRRTWARWRLQQLAGLPPDTDADALYLYSNSVPPPSAECLRVWRSLGDHGCLAWLSIQESAVQVGCESLAKLAATGAPGVGFVDLSPARHLGFSSALTLFHEHVTGPRLVYAAGMQAQALGQRQPGRALCSSNKELLRGDRPLLESPAAGCTLGVQPLGLNVLVAYRAWSHNQDDGTVWSLGAVQRGLFAHLESRAHHDRLQLEHAAGPPPRPPAHVAAGAGWGEVLACTQAVLLADARRQQARRGPRQLEGYLLPSPGGAASDGWCPPLGRVVLPGDTLLQALASTEPDGSDEACLRRTVAQVRGVVSQNSVAVDSPRHVWLDTDPSRTAGLREAGGAGGQVHVRVVVSRLLPFQYGDKITNASGQKCTLCVLLPDHALPYLPTGERPAVLLGPSQMFRKTINDCVTTLQTRLVAQYGRQLRHDVTGCAANYVWPWNQETLAYTALYAQERARCARWRPDFWWVLEAHCCPLAARLWGACLDYWLRLAGAQTTGPPRAALSRVLRLALRAADVGPVPAARPCRRRAAPHHHAADGSCRDAGGGAAELAAWAHAEEFWLHAAVRRAGLEPAAPVGGARRALQRLAERWGAHERGWRAVLLPSPAWADDAERGAREVTERLAATWCTEPTGPAPDAGADAGAERLRELHLRASVRMYSPANMALDPPDNPTLFGFQYYMRQDKTSEMQFKARHRGPIDPLTHQGTKSARVDGASKFDSMCLNAAIQSGSAALLEQVLQSSDARQDVVCKLCGRLGLTTPDGHAICLTRSCARATAQQEHPGLASLSTTYVLLKAIQTLDASGLMYKIRVGARAPTQAQ